MELSDLILKSRVDNVYLRKGPRPKQSGSIVLTSHHFIFSPAPLPGEKPSHDEELWLLHRAVDFVVSEKSPTKGLITLKCKNFMICVFELNPADCSLLATSIENLSNLNSRAHDYPFYYRCPFKILDNGWNIYDVQQEYSVLSTMYPNMFRLTSVNKDFNVCPTYPETAIVAKGIGDDYLRISATFREKGRFPVLSFVDQESHSILVRTSQPLLGPTDRRCTEDEAVFAAYLGSNKKGILFDTRPKSALASAKARGGGYQSPFYYRAWNVNHLDLPRIHELQESFDKIVDACNDNDNNFYTKVNASYWLSHIANILSKAGVIAQSMRIRCAGTTHIIHGHQGVDMTLVMTSLTALILNPDCRTIRGFQALIEREWISAGHPFGIRCAHSAYAVGTVTGPFESPVFLCFLNCVWQMHQIYPSAFEFTEQFLINIFEHIYASEFGTFMCSSDKERHAMKVRERSVSLWSYLNHPDILKAFMNPHFRPIKEPIWPVTAATSITLWERLFFRWIVDWTDIDEVANIIAETANKERLLQSKLAKLQSQKSQDAIVNDMVHCTVNE